MPTPFIGAAGGSTHAYTVLPHVDAAVDTLSRRASIFGGLGMDTQGRDRLVNTKDIGGPVKDIATSSAVYIKEISVGDEARFNLADDFEGEPTFGSYPVEDGQYPTFYHDNVRLNLMDSPGFPFWDEMTQQRFGNVISNMEPFYQEKIAHWLAEWTDFRGIEALLCGADRGQLLTTRGGLGRQIGNAAAAGDYLSCKNTYVAGHGMIDWNDTRLTFEQAIGTEIYDLIDDDEFGFNLAEHEKMSNQVASTLRFKGVTLGGMKIKAIGLMDPWLMRRLLLRESGNNWFVLMRDADTRGMDNHAINRDQSIIIDEILYIPVDWLRAFRAYGSDGAQPTYGAALVADPAKQIETISSTYYKCCIIYLGAGALLHAKTSKLYGAGTDVKSGGRIWFTHDFGKHGKGGGTACHTKGGFSRNEPGTKTDGTETYINNSSLVGWWYDPGPGEAFAA